MRSFHSLQTNFSDKIAVFTIDLEDGKQVYMSVQADIYESDRHVVVVDAERLIALWQNDPAGQERQLSYGNRASWKGDYKYSYAETGFAQGFDNPVPLANVSCLKKCTGPEEKLRFYVAFRDGITRTIWLLAHGAKSIPLECDNEEEARRLVSYVAPSPHNYMIKVSRLFASDHTEK